MKRRTFLKSTFALPILSRHVLGANEDLRIGAIGIGSTVKIGGKGKSDIRAFRGIPGVRVTAICDCDENHLRGQVEQFKKWGEPVRAYKDFRKLLEDKNVDAVTIATPNHWHSLMTILACQAGKDVHVQKPMSHNIFEGRKVVEAMRKYGRVVQATHGTRGKGSVVEAIRYLREGKLGKILLVHGLNYKPRMSIGKVDGPQPIPKGCDYDLWCGPAPKAPLQRRHLHYDWHWDWDTGNGDLGNMGIHFMDACRWFLGADSLPRRVVSTGGRFGYDDDGETPNTLVSLLDYEPVPILFEVRGLPRDASLREKPWKTGSMDHHHGVAIGTIVYTEGGQVHLSSRSCAAFDNDGKKILDFEGSRSGTMQNFVDAVRRRDPSILTTDGLEGHLSCALVHLANASYRVGNRPGAIQEKIKGEKHLQETIGRMTEHLKANRIDTPGRFGPVLSFDPKTERFTGPFSEEANKLVSRPARAPFVVPEKV